MTAALYQSGLPQANVHHFPRSGAGFIPRPLGPSRALPLLLDCEAGAEAFFALRSTILEATAERRRCRATARGVGAVATEVSTKSRTLAAEDVGDTGEASSLCRSNPCPSLQGRRLEFIVELWVPKRDQVAYMKRLAEGHATDARPCRQAATASYHRPWA